MKAKIPAELEINEKGTASIIVKMPDQNRHETIMAWLDAKTKYIAFTNEQGEHSTAFAIKP